MSEKRDFLFSYFLENMGVRFPAHVSGLRSLRCRRRPSKKKVSSFFFVSRLQLALALKIAILFQTQFPSRSLVHFPARDRLLSFSGAGLRVGSRSS